MSIFPSFCVCWFWLLLKSFRLKSFDAAMASRVALVLKNLPAYAGDAKKRWVRSLGQEDPLDEEMATHSRILAWKIIWTEEPGRLQSMGSQRVRHDWITFTHSPCPAYSHSPCQFGSDILIIVWASCYWSAWRHVLTCVCALFSGYIHHEHHRS